MSNSHEKIIFLFMIKVMNIKLVRTYTGITVRVILYMVP